MIQDIDVRAVNLSFIRANASTIDYLRGPQLRGDLFQENPGGAVSFMLTEFYVDHAEPLKVLERFKEGGRLLSPYFTLTDTANLEHPSCVRDVDISYKLTGLHDRVLGLLRTGINNFRRCHGLYYTGGSRILGPPFATQFTARRCSCQRAAY
ncbi:hypothetical protein EDB19DRAFT_720305 [Suillus lakei]|nr:hypothetical protein EDB19DRAFT_720305 [Suillus lakei]